MKKNNRRPVAQGHSVKAMNDHVYQLRQRVMQVIYHCKTLVPTLPRIEVRITDCEKPMVLGSAFMGTCQIFIPESTLSKSDAILHQVVQHEICHACFATPHVDDCRLMGPYLVPDLTKEESDALFIHYATGALKAIEKAA